MPRTYTVERTVYELHELSQNRIAGRYGSSPFERALENLRERVDFDARFVEEQFAERLEREHGFTVKDIFFDMSCSQGSGASFTGSVSTESDCKKFWEAIGTLPKGKDARIPGVEIKTNSLSNLYTHRNTVTAYLLEESDELENVEELEKAAEDWKNDRCRELYRELEKEWEATYSVEALAEFAEDMGYEFTEDGEIA